MIGRGGMSALPPVVKNLLIINGLMLLAAYSFRSAFGIDFWEIFGLHYFESEKFSPYQIVTYMFMHGDITHIFFNMFAVWMFGSAIENVWGSKRFLIYYLLTGFGAAILHYGIIFFELYPVLNHLELLSNSLDSKEIYEFAISHTGQELLGKFGFFENSSYQSFIENANSLLNNPDSVSLKNQMKISLMELSNFVKDSPNVVGASGSLFGILLAFGMMFPNMRLMLLFPPIPIKAKFLVIGYGVIELYSAFQNNPNDNVAHFAHLGGMLFGFLIIKFWEKTGQRWR